MAFNVLTRTSATGGHLTFFSSFGPERKVLDLTLLSPVAASGFPDSDTGQVLFIGRLSVFECAQAAESSVSTEAQPV